MNHFATKPILSIVVICFNMRREAQRTLYTLSSKFQQNASESDYQVIVIDNGSSAPLESKMVEAFGHNFEYHYFDTESPSPTQAINHGVELASGRYVGCIVDGARMVSPGTIYYSLLACNAFKHPFICSLAWHLGSKEQNLSLLEGYNQDREDLLLSSFDWRNNAHKLFDHSAQASSSQVGFLGGLPQECSYFVIEKSSYFKLGGFDERFQSPGGGLANHEFLQRAVKLDKFDFVILLGEGTFHQFHGGVATNTKPQDHPIHQFMKEYEKIYDSQFECLTQPSSKDISYFGSMPSNSLKFITT